MKKILLANGVWDLVEGTSTSKELDIKRDSSASAYLFQGLPEDLQMQVAGCETAKEIWDSLKTRFIGTTDVQQAHSQQLKSEFERLVMKEDESIDSFAGKLMSIITKAATCGLTFDEQTKVRKVLNAVPDKFVPIVATIEMIVDLKKVKLEEIIGKLKTYEERIKCRKGSQEDYSEKLLFTRQGNDRNHERNYGNGRRGGGNQTRGRGQGRFGRDSNSYDWRKNHGNQNYSKRDMREIECYNCHEFGHYAADCSQANHRKEVANLVEEDLEPTLLMAVTEDRRTYEDNNSDEKENSYLTSLAEYLNDEEPKWPRSSIERNEIPKNAKLRELKSEIEIEIKGKLEIWRLDMLHEFEATKQELKSELENRETELEKRMHKEKKLFEEEMKKELESLKSLREATNKEIEEVKIERAKLEKEKQDVLASQIHPEDEQLEEKEQERDGSMISRKKQDRVGDLSTKDEPVKQRKMEYK